PIAVATAADALPANLVATPPDSLDSNTAEISPASGEQRENSGSATSPNIDRAARAEYNPDIARYEAEQHGVVDPHQSQMLMQILQEEEFESTIGFELEETQRKLSSGERADGLLVVSVDPGSPADTAGLHP